MATINGVEVIGDKTAHDFDLLDKNDGINLANGIERNRKAAEDNHEDIVLHRTDTDIHVTPAWKNSLVTKEILGLYWTAAQTADIINEISIAGGAKLVKVEVLPAVGLEQTIYLVPKADPQAGDVFDEYVWVDGKYEFIGTTKANLSNYYTKVEIDYIVSQLDYKYVKSDDTTIVKLTNLNEINLQEDHYNAWFGYRGGKVTNWKFGDGTEGGLADVYVKDLYLGDEKLSDLLGDKATDADVVHKTGNETITGVKTFTSSTVIDGSGKFYQAYATDYIKGGVPSSAIYQGLRFYDDQKNSPVDNHITGAFEIMYNSDGYNKAYIGCRNYSDATQLSYNVGLRVPNDATKSVDFYPSVNNKINLGTSNYKWADVNTVLINGKTPAYDADVVHKSGDETIAGKKTFTGGAIELTPRATSDSTVAYLITNSNYTRGENPTTSLHNSFRVNDKNNNIVGEFCVENMENGSNQIQLDVRNTDSNGAQVYSSIYFDINKNGDERNFYPSADNLTNLGTSSKKWKDVNTNLINGETVVTPTYLENKAEEWEFTLSDGSTVTKKIVMA